MCSLAELVPVTLTSRTIGRYKNRGRHEMPAPTLLLALLNFSKAQDRQCVLQTRRSCTVGIARMIQFSPLGAFQVETAYRELVSRVATQWVSQPHSARALVAIHFPMGS